MNKKKNMWPYGIVVAFVLFALFIGSMVKRSMEESLNLESTDYYEQEVNYETKINKLKKANELGIQINEGETTQVLIVGEQNLPAKARVHFFRPSDESMDLKKVYEITEPQYTFNTTVLGKGKWILRVDLSTPNGDAFVEKEIMVK